jgi:hypothetical protein
MHGTTDIKFLQAVGRILEQGSTVLNFAINLDRKPPSRTSESNVNVKRLLVFQQLKKYQK